ncbi:MAG: hypothetical protein V1944_02175 [Candidatus Aenigmatarchaeota archaeon]
MRIAKEIKAYLGTAVDYGMSKIVFFQDKNGSWAYRKRQNSADVTAGNTMLLQDYFDYLKRFQPNARVEMFSGSISRGSEFLLSLYPDKHTFNEHLGYGPEPKTTADWIRCEYRNRDAACQVENSVETLESLITPVGNVKFQGNYRMQNEITAGLSASVALKLVGRRNEVLEKKTLSKMRDGWFECGPVPISQPIYWGFSKFGATRRELTSGVLSTCIEKLDYPSESSEMQEMREALLTKPIKLNSLVKRISKPTLLGVGRALCASDPERKLENLPPYILSAIHHALYNPPSDRLRYVRVMVQLQCLRNLTETTRN